jgi:hypothetical protein
MSGQVRTTVRLAAATWLFAACSATTSDGPEMSDPMTALPPSMMTASGTAQAGAAPAPVMTGASQAPAAAPSSGGAQPPPSGMLPGAAATMPSGVPPLPTADIKVTDRGSCPAPHRKASYHTPCGVEENPDPCGINTGFDGDEYCWPPPPEGEGVQLHIGPANYDDPAEIQKWIVEPGYENLEYIAGVNPLTENKWFNHVQVRMRPGSHHWIISLVAGKVEPGFYGQSQGCGSTSVGGIGGGQSLVLDNPPQGVPAPEDEGYGAEIQGNSSICANIHHYNGETYPQLREVWMNVYFTDESTITKRGERIGMIGAQGISLAPGRSQEYSYSARFGADGRIRSLFGHRHRYTDRFAVWLNDDLIYDSWDWVESVTFLYDSITMNPPINTEAKTDGAVSGLVNVKAGDTLKYSCFVNNTSDLTLTFRNDVDTGEMCNLFGGTVGEGTGLSANNL